MATKKKYSQMYLRWHATYEKRAYKELKKTFDRWIRNIPWDELTQSHYKSQISNALVLEWMTESYYKIYYNIGLTHGTRVGKSINEQLKAFNPFSFATIFDFLVGVWLREYGMQRVVTVRESFFEAIVDLFSEGYEKDLDERQLGREIQRIVKQPKFYKWQAERIARTEATAASNFGALKGGQTAGFEMVKEWIGTDDERTRRLPGYDHSLMDGVQVGLGDKFNVPSGGGNSDALEYPGDPAGEPGNVINCRCTVAVIPKRDENGRLIPTE